MTLGGNLVCWCVASALTISSTAVAKDNGIISYEGMCDASAISFISNDRFVVANDEDNTLRIYSIGITSPVSSLNIESFLNIEKGGRESDIEGATRIGNRIFWITSHGTNKNGKNRPERRRLFATDIVNNAGSIGISPVGKPYVDLVEDLISATNLDTWMMLSAGSKRAPKKGGLNIEGLATSPGGGLLIGLRSPVPMGYAAIVELKNPDEVISGGSPQFSDPHFLALGDGIGIRAIEYGQKPGSYIIVSGPISSEPGKFGLLNWDMFSGTVQPIEQKFGSMSPEAAARLPLDPNTLLLVSDDGSKKSDGKECKNLEDNKKQSFRSIQVKVSK